MQNAAHNRTSITKLKTAFFTVLVIALLVGRVPAASLTQTIVRIDSDAKAPLTPTSSKSLFEE